MDTYHGTTILSVRRGPLVALGGDGQVTLGHIVVKASARKVRRLYKEQVLAGFDGDLAGDRGRHDARSDGCHVLASLKAWHVAEVDERRRRRLADRVGEQQ